MGFPLGQSYLNFAIDQGFLVRYQDISDLDVNMTRGMLAKLAANALGLSDPGTYGTFTDTDSVYVEALYAAGIVGGYPDGTYRPDASVSARRSPRSSTAFIRVSSPQFLQTRSRTRRRSRSARPSR